MGMSAGENNQIGPGKFVLSNFRLADGSTDLIRQETHPGGGVIYTACLADAVLSDTKGQVIQADEQNSGSKVRCFTVQQDSKAGKILTSTTSMPSIGNEDMPPTTGNKIFPETDSPCHSHISRIHCYLFNGSLIITFLSLV